MILEFLFKFFFLIKKKKRVFDEMFLENDSGDSYKRVWFDGLLGKFKKFSCLTIELREF